MAGSQENTLHFVNNPGAHRWEAHLDQQLAVVDYRQRGNMIFFLHTAVPHELEGHGVASQLVKLALEEARKEHLAVVPFCPFVADYIRRHPDEQDLVPLDYRDLVEGKPG
jgi:predicted GNAT family acetyltransferase